MVTSKKQNITSKYDVVKPNIYSYLIIRIFTNI
jgi:hypothetical protein